MQFQACAYCDHPNPVGTNFCNHCGAALHIKPCRNCGAVAAANAHACPACHFEFPNRPTINVDMPWVTAGAAGVGAAAVAPADAEAGATSAMPVMPKAVTAGKLAASAEAHAATQRLIEKASSRRMPNESAPELVLPDGRGELGSASSGPAGRAPGRGTPALVPQHSPDPLADALFVEEAATLDSTDADEDTEPAAVVRFGPMIFLSLLGLVAAVALVYLLRYAGDGATGPVREITSPHRLLLPAAPTAAPGPAWSGTDAPTATPIEGPEEVTETSAVDTRQLEPAAPVTPPAAGDCRAELRALNLCGKVSQRH